MLTKEEVVKLSQLARIEIKENEVEKFQKELSTILDYVQALKEATVEVKTELDPAHEVTGLVNIVRDDKAIEATNRDEILGQAPETKDGYFKVKAIL